MEEWRDVPEYGGKYQISINTKEGKCRNRTRRELSNKPSKQDKRIYWVLTINGKATTQQAARWIAITYPELVQNEYFPGAEIDHINTDRLDNHPSNLRWVDRRTNLNNPLTREHMSDGQIGKRNRLGKGLTTQQYKNGTLVAVYKTLSDASKQTGIHLGDISECCLGKRKTAGGFTWKYAE